MIHSIPDSMVNLMAEKFRSLADPTRLSILKLLLVGERSVGKIVEETGRGQANVSKHLKLLAASGLVGRRKEGLQVFYRVESPFVEKLCTLVCETIARETEEQIMRRREMLDTLTAADSKRANAIQERINKEVMRTVAEVRALEH